MNAHESTDFLTPLVPVSHENDILDRTRAADCMASGWPGIERVVMSDIAPPTVVGRKRVGK